MSSSRFTVKDAISKLPISDEIDQALYYAIKKAAAYVIDGGLPAKVAARRGCTEADFNKPTVVEQVLRHIIPAGILKAREDGVRGAGDAAKHEERDRKLKAQWSREARMRMEFRKSVNGTLPAERQAEIDRIDYEISQKLAQQ